MDRSPRRAGFIVGHPRGHNRMCWNGWRPFRKARNPRVPASRTIVAADRSPTAGRSPTRDADRCSPANT